MADADASHAAARLDAAEQRVRQGDIAGAIDIVENSSPRRLTFLSPLIAALRDAGVDIRSGTIADKGTR
jgi:hypothetical protein